VIRTREGILQIPGVDALLYAVAWVPIDECPGKDLSKIKPTTDSNRFN